MSRGPGALGWCGLALVLGFLYLPLAGVVGYSFNAGRLVTVWSGFSLRWYAELFRDRSLLDAILNSLGVATAAATLASALGVCAGVALAGRARRSALLAAGVYMPLAAPDILLGLSMLLLFVALQIPRGFATVIAAHATVGLAYVAIVVRARLARLDPALEQAALDLGASPPVAFATVTAPLLAPAAAAGWLLAFSLSLDDLVIASFTAGPGAATLPMRLYSQIRLGVSPAVNAASTLMVLAAGAAALAYAAVAFARASRPD